MSPDSQPSEDTESNLALRPPVMTILSDHPILRDRSEDKPQASHQGDSFELHTRLGAVYDIIRHQNTRAPLAVGIFGDWGTGKSSAMRWLSDQLAAWSASGVDRKGHYRCRCVWFEPWKYQTRDDVWRGLIAEVVINSIDPKKASVATVVHAAKKFGGALGRWFIHAVSSLEVSGGASGVGEATLNLESLAKIAEDYKQTVHPEKAYLNEFESTLKSWVKGSLANDERMVLFIDDLDRCLPAVVLEVLEALKLYLNIPQLLFVIGLDRDVVKAVIRKQYRDAGLAEMKADSYLDKMFQVEVEVPPSEEQMDGYFETQVRELDNATDNYWTKQLNAAGTGWKAIIEKAIKDIAVHNPREIKRLLNSTLMGGTAAARKAKDDQETAKRFGQGCQAYLIARILRDDPLCPSNTLRFTETWRFLEEWSKFIREYPSYIPPHRRQAEAVGKAPVEPDPQTSAVNAALHNVRKLVPQTRDDKPQPIPLMERPVLWDVLAIECSALVGLAVASPTLNAKAEQIPPLTGAVEVEAVAVKRLPLVVHSRLAQQLGKRATVVTLHDIASVTELNLAGSDLNDDGLRKLARPDTGLKALTSLSLGNTQVTDAGVQELARTETGLKDLTTLSLWGTKVTDAAVQALAHAGTGLKALTTLNLCSTQVTDMGVQALACAETGLKDLTALLLWGTPVTDAAVQALAHSGNGLKALTTLDLGCTKVTDTALQTLADAETGLKALTTLDLSGTQVTDAGVQAIARADTGLKALTKLHLRATLVTDTAVQALSHAETSLTNLALLDLSDTQVTDAGLKELARVETGLKALTRLDLSETQVTDAGLKELACAETGIKALTMLYLGWTLVTDAGVQELARADTGLKALTVLDLSGTQVTDSGLQALARAGTGLKALITLNLGATQVTDTGVQALSRAEIGLKSLTKLSLRATQVTDTGVAALKARFPDIRIYK